MSRHVATVLLLSIVVPGALAPGLSPAAEECAVTPHPSWKSPLEYPGDPFAVDPAPNPRWVKFSILRCDPTRVYFQNSREFPFHYDFAAAHLDPFRGASRQEFDARTLHLDGQEAVLGAVILPPSASADRSAFGIQLVGRDPYPADLVVELFHAVAASVDAEGAQAYYFPTFEQRASAEADAAFLAEQGVFLGSPDRWSRGSAIYASGWALGTLRFVPAGEIAGSYESGALRPSDVLLTDGVPAEVPFVQGILTLAAATPNSHVAILARSYGAPFVHLSASEDAQRALSLVDRKVIVSAFQSFEGGDFRLLDIEGRLAESAIEEILALKDLPPLELTPVSRAGAYSLAVEGLGPADIGRVGGKAANYGLLLRAIPDNARVAAAFTFDLWTDFLEQPLGNGNTLREEIAERLAPHASYPPADIGALLAALDGVRELFTDRDATEFTPELRQAVVGALQDPSYGFDLAKKIRVRSSTNFEDAERVTGAGLFDSFSGCLLDDLDGDDDGPSHCDPERASEQGIFRAIRRVFASFYNDNAYLERLRWSVDEADVGMALLTHHSFPDETELANGVATLTPTGPNFTIEMVTQVGATSVANPEDGSLPEVVQVTVFRSGTAVVELVRESNLVRLGATVLDWTAEYESFAALFVQVAEAFREATGKTRYTLDLEYKKVAPGDELVVKQVREIPQPDTAPSITPFLVDAPLTFTTLQGEAGDIFANHRLKSTWELETRSMWLTDENLRDGIFTRLKLDSAEACGAITFEGDVSALPAVEQGAGDDGTAFLTWRFGASPESREYRLSAGPFPRLVAPSRSPFVTLEDARPLVDVTYETPVVGWDGGSQQPRVTSEETIALAVEPQPRDGDLEQVRQVEGDGVSITTRFFWPPPPAGPVAGYTAPLVRWVETVIEGLSSEPIVLVGDRSQTYRPEHHNFSEHFLFAPHREEGISPDLLAELDARDVRWIHVLGGNLGSRIDLFGACDLALACVCDEAPVFRRGDANDDGGVDISDAVFTLLWLFAGGPPPGCETVADTNGGGKVDIADATYLLQFLFAGGPAPRAPFPACGRVLVPGEDPPPCETPPQSCAAPPPE